MSAATSNDNRPAYHGIDEHGQVYINTDGTRAAPEETSASTNLSGHKVTDWTEVLTQWVSDHEKALLIAAIVLGLLAFGGGVTMIYLNLNSTPLCLTGVALAGAGLYSAYLAGLVLRGEKLSYD